MFFVPSDCSCTVFPIARCNDETNQFVPALTNILYLSNQDSISHRTVGNFI